MPRRRGCPEWWPDPKRDLETVAIERVIRSLEAEGRLVTDLWYPDRQPKDPRIRGRRLPDAAMLVDGLETAIDETGSWPHSVSGAAARASRTAKAVRAKIKDHRLGVGVSVFGTYDIPMLRARKDGWQHDADIDLIAEAVLEVARSGLTEQVPLPPGRLPAWLTATITVHAVVRGSVSVSFWPPWDEARVAERLEEIVNDKGDQLAKWGLGIVAIMHSHGSMELMTAAIAARGELPFWRMYWIDAGQTHLIWSRDAGEP